MLKSWCFFLLGLTSVAILSEASSGELFTSSFLVKFKRSIDSNLAHKIAQRNGFYNIGEVSIRNFYYTPKYFHEDIILNDDSTITGIIHSRKCRHFV